MKFQIFTTNETATEAIKGKMVLKVEDTTIFFTDGTNVSISKDTYFGDFEYELVIPD